MEMRPLGATGMRVSVLGLGTVKLGRTRGLKYPGAAPSPVTAASSHRSVAMGHAALPGDDAVMDLLRAAHALGINLIDTAPAYGVSEERLGALLNRMRWLADAEESLESARNKWIVCTKVGEEFDDAEGVSRHDFSPAHVRSSLERSLRRLRVERLDVVLLHSDGRDEWVVRESGALEELDRARAEGLIRAIGVSTKSLAGGLAAVERLREIAGKDGGVVMVTYNPEHEAERPVIDAASRAGIGVLVKKGLASGHASDAAGSIRFVLRHPGVSSLVVGTTSAGHLESNAEAALAG